jgi:hypothetical protein
MVTLRTPTAFLLALLACNLLAAAPLSAQAATKTKALGAKEWLKTGAIGAGVGAGVGAATGAISGKGTLRGAGIGAVTGVGAAVVEKAPVMQNHPLIKRTVQGAIVGTGGAAILDKNKWGGAAVGAGAGAGAGVLGELLKNK